MPPVDGSDKVVVSSTKTEDTTGLYNRASILRGWNADNTVAKNIPRFKFSFMADFRINPLANDGGFSKNLTNGSLMNAIKSIDMPTISYEVETLPQYNRIKNITKKQKRNDVSITLYDDSTSFVKGLLAAYRAHYTFASLYGLRDKPTEHLSPIKAEYGTPLDKVSDDYPSMGMRPVDGPFFESIVIYDLGSEPASANVYHLINPVIKDVTSGGFDYGDNEAPREVTIVFGYEELVEHIGLNIIDKDYVLGMHMPDLYEHGILFAKRSYVSSEVDIGHSYLLQRSGVFQPDRSAAAQDIRDFFVEFDASKDRIATELARAGTGPGPLLIAVQKSIYNGVVNFEDLQQNVFRALARGTAVQNIRIVARKALLIRQAIEQGRFLDVIPLLGAGWDQIKDFSWETVGTSISSVTKTIQGAVPGASSWAGSHLNGLQLPKIGGAWGGG